MFDRSHWKYVCASLSELPEEAKFSVNEQVRSQLGRSIGQLFPLFELAFPMCVDAFDQRWGLPVLALSEIAQTWVAKIVMPGDGKNFFFPLRSREEPVSGEQFDLEKAMLPNRWRELYRCFDSFGSSSTSNARDWIDTPFSHANRLDLAEYAALMGGGGDERILADRIGSSKIRCWLLTEAGDALWLNEDRCDQIVYHIRGAEYGDAVELLDPEGALDHYLCHFVSWGRPGDFDFRRS